MLRVPDRLWIEQSEQKRSNSSNFYGDTDLSMHYAPAIGVTIEFTTSYDSWLCDCCIGFGNWIVLFRQTQTLEWNGA